MENRFIEVKKNQCIHIDNKSEKTGNELLAKSKADATNELGKCENFIVITLNKDGTGKTALVVTSPYNGGCLMEALSKCSFALMNGIRRMLTGVKEGDGK